MPERPRRILLVEASDDGTIGGSHRALLDLVAGLDRSRFEPVVAFTVENRAAAALRAHGVETHVVPPSAALPAGLASRALAFVRGARKRASFLRDRHVDLVHLNNSLAIGFDDWLPGAIVAGIPCITHQRADSGPASSRIGRFLVGRYDRVIAISDHIRRGLAAYGIDADRAVRIYDGIDLARLGARLTRDRDDTRRLMQVGPSDLVVAMVGHLRAWKGQDAVLEALALLSPALRQRLRVWFIGDAGTVNAPFRSQIERRREELGLTDCTRLLGERDDALDLMAASDVVLHASTIPEPFGLVVLEGMALGRAVIASSLGGPAEVLAGGGGVVVDPRDAKALAAALLDVLGNPDRTASLGREGLERVQEFDASRTVDAISQVYEQLLG